MEVVLAQLLEPLCQRLRGQQRGGLWWRCLLKSKEQPPVEILVKLFQPTSCLEYLMPLVKVQLERACTKHQQEESHQPMAWEVQEICISVSHIVVMTQQQRSLFDEQRPNGNRKRNSQALAPLVDRLSNRLGAKCVLKPCLRRQAQMEQAYWFEPLVGQVREKEHGKQTNSHKIPVTKGTRSSWRTQKAWGTGQKRLSGPFPWQRPLTFLESPVPLEAVAPCGKTRSGETRCGEARSGKTRCGKARPRRTHGTESNGQARRQPQVPAMFVCGQQCWRVRRCWGPERIETAWWRGATLRRDYWRVETERGQWLWVFYDLRQQVWFLQGAF